MKRRCNSCQGKGAPPVEATYVVSDAMGMLWFECENHEPTDNIAGVERVSRTPIAEWFASIGINVDELEDIDDDEPSPTTERA